MSPGNQAYVRFYIIRGEGDAAAASALQARLISHGTCSYFGWDPRPPRWRFSYDTDLSQAEIELLLGPLRTRFKIAISS
ncbi:MAG TPA: hypothetical protein VLC95_02750 [Anaerolineae bacterium]|nr:hypothetical protein [Anaerolineae bacterium]